MANDSMGPAAVVALILAAGLAACGTNDEPPSADTSTTGSSEPPRLLNEELPVAYHATLWARGVGGEVTLRLFVDSTGAVLPDSTRVERSSGEPQLDSAALRGVPEMRFSPGVVGGRPVNAALLVPVVFDRDTLPADSVAPDSAAPASG